MAQKLVSLLSADAGTSPAELLFGPMVFLDAPDSMVARESSRHWLSMAEMALRTQRMTDCARCISQAMRALPTESRPLTAREWLFLAGLSLLNGNDESCQHQLQMAQRFVHRTQEPFEQRLLRQRIMIVQSLRLGLMNPEDGLQELLGVFRFLATTRCPELCEQALRVRNVLLAWSSDGEGNSDGLSNPPVSNQSWRNERRGNQANPEWN
ncbi:MAG: hypothetical protein U0996_09525 [Planctomycetaceae bacterium]